MKPISTCILSIILGFALHSLNGYSQNSATIESTSGFGPYGEMEGGGIIIIGDGILPPPPPSVILRGRIVIQEEDGGNLQFYMSCRQMFTQSISLPVIFQDKNIEIIGNHDLNVKFWQPAGYVRRLNDYCNNATKEGILLEFSSETEYIVLRNWLIKHEGELVWFRGDFINLDAEPVPSPIEDEILRKLIDLGEIRIKPESIF